MSICRIALANVRFPSSPEDSIALARQAILAAANAHADVLCFPECFVPGYRAPHKSIPPPDPAFLHYAHTTLAATAGQANLTLILGTERIVDDTLRATALVIHRDGSIAGFQDKVQLAPEEENTYSPGHTRHVFHSGPLTFGIAICHEGWRYPETVRWPVLQGAQIVFHLQFHEADNPSARSTSASEPFADPASAIFEMIPLCRAAENACYFATVNYASPNAPTTSAIIRPDGSVLAFQPHGTEGILIADIDPEAATGLYAHRLKPIDQSQ
ncbi:MAG: carbon-nitrogen hydrolase family protein [Acidobacteriaceae bacterium]